MINLFVKYSDYDKMPLITDVDFQDLNAYKYLLVVCAREGQKIRLLKQKDEGIHNAEVSGVWDLSGTPIDDLEKWDAVYILDPDRIGYPGLREQWERLLVWTGQ